MYRLNRLRFRPACSGGLTILLRLPPLLLLTLLPGAASWAQTPLPRMEAQIQASGQGVNGQLMLNQAAGTGIQQLNARVLTVGAAGTPGLQLQQSLDPVARESVGIHASARIEGASFGQGHGVLGINQSAGVANQAINSFRMVLGTLPAPLEDSILLQNAAPTLNSDAVVPQSGVRVVEVDDRAFAASRGVVQLNQSAGVGNRTANNLSIRVMD